MNDPVEDPLKADLDAAKLAYVLYAVSYLFFITIFFAIFISYRKKNDAADSWVRTHFEWQLQTALYTLYGLGEVLLITVVVLQTAALLIIGLLAVTAWNIYRLVVGWLALEEKKPMVIT